MAQRRLKCLTDDQLFADWVRWLERSYHEMVEQGWRHRMFRLLRGIYQENSELCETGGFFLKWAADNYVVASVMALRRELDGQAGAENLFHLLCELRDKPSVICRARFKATWEEGREQDIADRAFEELQIVRHPEDPDRDHIDPAMVREDLLTLQGLGRVVEHAQTTVAHRMPAISSEQIPTFGELHAAIEALRTVLRRYYLMLTHQSIAMFEPTEGFNLYVPFRSAWIRDAEAFDYKRCK